MATMATEIEFSAMRVRARAERGERFFFVFDFFSPLQKLINLKINNKKEKG